MTSEQWAEAIAERVSDEWSGKEDFPEDAKLLKAVLSKVLAASPLECARLIGTGIIEENYFTPLD